MNAMYDLSCFMAIDPGASGGIAVWFPVVEDGPNTQAYKMPKNMTGVVNLLRDLRNKRGQGYRCMALVEKVGGYMPGNSGPSAAKFARHCGNIEAALYALGIAFDEVVPTKWMKAIGTVPKDKGERKRFIQDRMQRRFPHLNVTLCTADALGILVYGADLHGIML